ncbi:periplasmic heavy metal sensor [Marivita sp. S6314]|uniref:periplasmic heavy metal sensor n=1 Tax=Marivita sp. S6314 TaxID=2926406 RepID=UPI001FF0F6F6|nr:periplasmic heavy metal sensor [Marivita sp. S6314]MCK0150650.1 periplasmic heavy metal sensor [Marivita sp. S6314]
MDKKASLAKTPLWMRIVLFSSLALNLLVVGLVVGAIATGGPERRAGGKPRDVGSVFTRALDADDRAALRRDFVAQFQRPDRDRRPVLTDLETALETLRATPFDEAAFLSAMAEQSDRRAARDAFGRQALAASIAAMSDADRAAYADRVAQGVADIAKRMRRDR